jgi:DNA-binding MarR family transcriptional regulator
LEDQAYVSRTVDTSDKRANTVALTDKGRRTAEAIRAIRKEIAQEFFSAITEEEAGEIVRALGKAVD